MTNARDKEKML